jgi:hypothetical protein
LRCGDDGGGDSVDNFPQLSNAPENTDDAKDAEDAQLLNYSIAGRGRYHPQGNKHHGCVKPAKQQRRQRI